VPLGTGVVPTARAPCPSLCSSRTTPPGALVPGIGILSETARKNGWQLAEHAREGSPDGMQRLLSDAVWDTDGVRDELRADALEHLGQESAILVIDETSFRQQGQEVGRRWCAVVRHDWAGGELSGGRLALVRDRPWAYAH